jgi:hypothetical protein
MGGSGTGTANAILDSNSNIILLQLMQYNVLSMPKFALIDNIAAGDTTIQVNSTIGLKSGDLLLVGTINSSTIELRIISSVTANTITFTVALNYAHNYTKETVRKTLFDQFSIYSGSVPDSTLHTLLDTIPIEWNINLTTYPCVDGKLTDYYSFAYSNSVTGNISQRRDLNAYGMQTDITPEYIKENYLYGLDLTDDSGMPLPDSLYWHGIKAAHAWMESQLGIDIIQRSYTNELHDYEGSKYTNNFIKLRTNHYPIKEIVKITGDWYGQIINFPLDWAKIEKAMGSFHLVPQSGSMINFITGSGTMTPLLLKSTMELPLFWNIDYTTGYDVNTLPYDVRDLMCKRACFMPLNIEGDLVGGVAIASKSIGVDGLSQSISTTNSPENAGFSARLRTYQKEIKDDLPQLKVKYRRMNLSVI